jgi:hypothetical protein
MTRNEGEPHGRQSKKLPFGWLKNGNAPCDIRALPRCQAKAKSTASRCRNPAMKEKLVCWIHGGKSTGPTTPEGLERCRKANWRHGYYSAEAVAERRYIAQLLRESRLLTRRIRERSASEVWPFIMDRSNYGFRY